MRLIYKVCSCCNEAFLPSSNHLKCSKCRYHKRKTFCPLCGIAMHDQAAFCIQCWNKQRKPWKKVFHKRGYRLIRIGRRYKFEHVLIMEMKLGRKLKPGENIHHINGVKDDNRLSNLELWIRPHPTGIRIPDAVKWARHILKLYT